MLHPFLRSWFGEGRHRFILFIGFAALLLSAAKCIDNETLYQDASGDWHVVGEIHNETDVWGVDMTLQGQLLDTAGNVIATTQTPVCPLELAAHSFNGFDLHFTQSSGLAPASYKVNVIRGHVIENALPDSELSLEDFKANRSSDGVNINGTVTTGRTYNRVLTGCIAFYNSSGRVVTHVTAINFGLTLPLSAGEPQFASFTVPKEMIEPDAANVRLWLAGDSDVPLASDYAAVMTGLIDIQ